MLCEHCQERQANVHITQVVNDKRVEMNLCEACYKKEAGKFNFIAPPGISLPNLLTGFFQTAQPKEEPSPGADEQCRSCGLRFSDFTQAGQLGCSECYTHFGGRLEPVLRRIHGHTTHLGKVPRRTGGIVRVRKELDSLRQMLQEAVRREAYEEAARLRDEIHRREDELKKGGNP